MTKIELIPKPKNNSIRLLEIKDIIIPHPYCNTPKHLEYSDSMYLDIEKAEKKGAICDICKNINMKTGKKILSYNEHIKQKTLFIGVPQNKDLNKVEGLIEYLNKIKPIAERLKIDGFAFPVNKD